MHTILKSSSVAFKKILIPELLERGLHINYDMIDPKGNQLIVIYNLSKNLWTKIQRNLPAPESSAAAAPAVHGAGGAGRINQLEAGLVLFMIVGVLLA
jgi:hypothetical protein